MPQGWTGAVKAFELHHPPVLSGEVYTKDIEEARQLDLWREPALPEGWTLRYAGSSGVEFPSYGYCAVFSDARGGAGVEICGVYDDGRFEAEEARYGNGTVIETRTIASRPAVVGYRPRSSPNATRGDVIWVWVYEAATETRYRVLGRDHDHSGGNVDAVIRIARSLFESPNAFR